MITTVQTEQAVAGSEAISRAMNVAADENIEASVGQYVTTIVPQVLFTL